MFPGTVSKFFPKLLVNIPVAPIITGTIHTVTCFSSCTGLGMCMYHWSVVSVPKALHIEKSNVYKLYRVSLNIRSSPKWGIPRLSVQ